MLHLRLFQGIIPGVDLSSEGFKQDEMIHLGSKQNKKNHEMDSDD